MLTCVRWLIGLKSDVVPGVIALNDDQVAYVCGHSIVIYNHNPKKISQQYIHGKPLSR